MAFPFLAAASVAAPIVGGLIGADQANKDRDAANAARQQALAQFAGINVPTPEEQKLLLDQYVSTGVMSPELESLINMGPTAYEGISLDPQARQAQLDSLSQMGQLAQTGMTQGDEAAYEMARRNAAAESQAKQAQILQNMQARGMGGSGVELISRLQAGQSSADRLQQAQLEEAAKKQQARMQALQSQANMAQGLRSSDYSEAARLADAKDQIARFNAANAQSLANRNTDRGNQAQQYNMSNAQRIADANVGLKNQQQQYNKGLTQQKFGNELQLAGAKAGQYGSQAQDASQRAGQTASMWGGIGQGVGTMLQGLNTPAKAKKPFVGPTEDYSGE